MKKEIYEFPDLKKAQKRVKDKEIKRVEFSLDQKYFGLGEGQKYYIITHGCQANQRDSETMAGLLEDMGYKMTNIKEDADVIMINTCAVRQNAEEKVLGELGALKQLKRNKPDLIIGLGGCMCQEEESVKIVLEKYHQVDIILGTHNVFDLPKLIFDTKETKKRIVDVKSMMGEVVENVPVTRFMKHKAWVNIMYGCDKFCTYCIVPYTRGTERSRRLEDIVFEVEELKRQGYKEVCLLGQNVNAYGKDLNLGYGFGELIEKVAETGISRVRFMTSHPKDFDEDMIQAISRHSNIMPYIHLPLQSGSSEILRRMNRKYDAEGYKKLYSRLKEVLPNFTFTTDIIVGFPGESEKDFNDTLDMVDFCKYDNAFTFIYSPRIGTPAAVMDNQIDEKVKEERLQILNKKIGEYANMNNQKYLGQIVEVLVDGKSKTNKETYSGYSRDNKLVNFKGECEIGDIVNVKIEAVKSFSLDGIQVK